MINNFQIVNADTDSISFCKPDMSPISPEEQENIIKSLNSVLPEKIQMAHDGYFKAILVCAGKNYVMVKDNGDVKIKGSALKATNKPKALQEYINRIINILISDD